MYFSVYGDLEFRVLIKRNQVTKRKTWLVPPPGRGYQESHSEDDKVTIRLGRVSGYLPLTCSRTDSLTDPITPH